MPTVNGIFSSTFPRKWRLGRARCGEQGHKKWKGWGQLHLSPHILHSISPQSGQYRFSPGPQSFPFRFQINNLVKTISVPCGWPQIVVTGSRVQCVASVRGFLWRTCFWSSVNLLLSVWLALQAIYFPLFLFCSLQVETRLRWQHSVFSPSFLKI